MTCRNCHDEFSEDNPQCIESFITAEDQLCSECGYARLDKAYDIQQQIDVPAMTIALMAPELLTD